MKAISLLFTGMLFCYTADAQLSARHIPVESPICLRVEGFIEHSPANESDSCMVEIISNGRRTDTIVLKGRRKRFECYLEKNSYYGIRITMKDHAPKLIGVFTDLPESDSLNLYRFSFETKLYSASDVAGMNTDALDFPIAIIHFDPKKLCFDYNKIYTARIKSELRNPRPVAMPSPIAAAN
jgi:hypothetical protein